MPFLDYRQGSIKLEEYVKSEKNINYQQRQLKQT